MLDVSLQRRLRECSWFEKCGDDVAAAALVRSLPSLRHVSTPKQALDLILSEENEDNDLEVFNTIGRELDQKGGSDDKRWNEIAAEARAFVRTDLAPTWSVALERYGLAEKRVIDTIVWHTLGMFQELDNFDQLKTKTRVNTGIYLPVYEAGFIPCGWAGVWPKATPLFY